MNMDNSPAHLLKEKYRLQNAIKQRQIRDKFSESFGTSNDTTFYNVLNNRVDLKVSHLLFFARAFNESNPMLLLSQVGEATC